MPRKHFYVYIRRLEDARVVTWVAMPTPPLDRLFLDRARDYLADEYPAKLRLAMAALPEDRLWWRPNDGSNSVGNLLMHLNGNLRQWIVAGVGGESFDRDRAGEFAARAGRSASDLVAALEKTIADVDRVLSGLSAVRLSERCMIQGRDLTVLDAIFHVTEHFAYHLGQVILIVKSLESGRVHLYDDAGGLARPLWHK
jgi:uncharacterized damage-inducible protein DinB